MMNDNDFISNSIHAEQTTESNVITDTSFSYDGYQVVRGEFFAHLFEPSVTLNNEKVSVNSACINKLPDTDYVQFLVNPIEKKLAVKPCPEEAKDSFCWTSLNSEGKKRPKTISCKIFFAKVMQLMEWDPNYRYKILGKLIRTPTEQLFVFDLNCAETFQKRKNNETTNPRTPFYPQNWSNQFGLSVSEHQDSVLINIFDDYAVFKIEKDEEIKEDSENDSNFDTGYEEGPNTNSQINTDRA